MYQQNSREILAFSAILLLALSVRIPGLFDSLWLDEVWYTQTMFSDPDRLARVLWGDVHPPVYPLALLIWTQLFGDSEVSVRLPSLMCGMASLVVFWYVTRRWMGRSTALLTITLLALSPPHIWYSNENKVNMLLMLLTLGSVWLYWRASELRRASDWVVTALVLTMALFTHAYAVPVAAAIFAWLGWRAVADQSLVKPTLASAVGLALVYTPLVLSKFEIRGELLRTYLRQLTPEELYKLLLVWLPSGNTFRAVHLGDPLEDFLEQPWFHFLIEAFFAVLLFRGLWVLGRRARGDGWLKPVADPAETEPARLVLLWLMMPLLATIVGSMLSEHFYLERNLLVILPPFLLVLALGTHLGRPPRANPLLVTALLSLTLMATLNLRVFKSDAQWTVYSYKPDWRSAAAYLREEISTGLPLRLLVTIPTLEHRYYGDQVILTDTTVDKRAAIQSEFICGPDPESQLRRLAYRGWSGFYLIRKETWDGCWPEVWEAISTNHYFQIVEEREFKGMTIAKIRVNSGYPGN